MNKNLRLKIEESIEKITLSENLCYLCLACLNEKITYSKNHFPKLENQRDKIAKVALNNGVSKEILQEKLRTISKNDYPTFKQIERVYNVIENGFYNWEHDFIPDRWIHLKSDEEIQEDAQRKPVAKTVDVAKQEYEELCDYIEKEIMFCELVPSMKKKIQEMKTEQYSYSVILETFKRYDTDIKNALSKNETNFKTESHKFNFVIGIVRNYLPDTYRMQEHYKKAAEAINNIDFSILNAEMAPYQRRTKDLNPVLIELLKEHNILDGEEI